MCRSSFHILMFALSVVCCCVGYIVLMKTCSPVELCVCVFVFEGGELMPPYGSHHLMANEVIIGVSIVCVAIFLTVVVVIVIAARRRSILLRLARVRMMRRCADSVTNDQLEYFPGFMEPKPPPYDFLPPTAPSYTLRPPPYNSQSSDGESNPCTQLPPPSYETETFVAKQEGDGAVGGRDPEEDVFGIHPDDGGNVRGGIRTTSI